MSDRSGTRKCAMVRTTARVAVCLGLGLVLSVASAWIAAVYAPQPGTTMAEYDAYRLEPREVPEDLVRVLPPNPAGMSYEPNEEGGRARGWGVVRERIFVRVVLRADGQVFKSTGNDARVFVNRFLAGWPLAALAWTDPDFDRTGITSGTRTRFERVWEFGFDLSRGRIAGANPEAWRRLPVRVNDGGVSLAIDAVVWGLLVAPLVAIPGMMRRRRRRRRGPCVACGYPVRDADGVLMQRCPECGRETDRLAAVRAGSSA